MRKAARIAAGSLSDSGEDDYMDEAQQEDEEMTEGEELERELEREREGESEPAPSGEEGSLAGSFDAPSTLAMAIKNANISDDPDKRRQSMAVESTRSSSPRECPTPRSHRGALGGLTGQNQSRRESMLFESDAGDSDGSMRSSSAASRPPQRTDSPMSEFGDLRRQASSRQHHRRRLPSVVIIVVGKIRRRKLAAGKHG